MSYPQPAGYAPAPNYVPPSGQVYVSPQVYGGLENGPQGQGFANSQVGLQEKRLSYIFLTCTVIVLVLMIVDLNLKDWTDYCNTDVGLTEISGDGDTESISHIEDLICEISQVGEDSCGNICHNLRKFKAAGQVVLGLGIPAIVLLVVAGVRVALLLLNPSRRWSGPVIKVSVALQALLWTIATVVYIVLFALVVDNASSRTSVGGGLVLSIVVCCLTIANGSMGLYVAKGLLN